MRHSRAVHQSRRALFDVACLVALSAVASCGTPFTSAASPCADQGGDCAIISGHVDQAGAATQGKAGDVSDPGDEAGAGGAAASIGSAGQGGADSGGGGEPTSALPTSCHDALER